MMLTRMAPASTGCSGGAQSGEGACLQPWVLEPGSQPAPGGPWPQVLTVQGAGKVEWDTDLHSHIAESPAPAQVSPLSGPPV